MSISASAEPGGEPVYVRDYNDETAASLLEASGKLFFDPLYQVLVVWPLWLLAEVCYWIDRTLIDGLVNLIGWIPPTVAAGLR